MKLYHYSKELYDKLKTKRISGLADKKEIEEAEKFQSVSGLPGAYVDHISFFFDPIPYKEIGNIYGNFHSTWYNGSELNEYIIDTRELDNDITYYITETPNQIKLLDNTDWIDTDEFLLEYKKKLNALKKEWKEIGHSKKDLEEQIKLYKGKTLDYYIKARKRRDYEENKFKYAANVPHSMIYPKSGIIEYESVSKIIIGPKTKPNYVKW